MKITKYVKFTLFFLFIFSLNNCFSQSSNISSGCAPLNVTFTAPSGYTTFFWDFKDGASSNIQNPSNTFTTAGTYNVEFRSTPTGPIIGVKTINVYNKPTITFNTTSLLKGCIPLTVNLNSDVTATSGINILNYSWSMGEGSGLSGANVTNFTYFTPGVYDISLSIITNLPSCDNTVTFNDIISTSNPIASFFTNPNPPFACTPPLNVTFYNNCSSTLPLTYSWDFANGNTSTLNNPTIQTYSTNGQFNVGLTITDTNNCVKTFNNTVTIGAPIANFTLPDTVCKNQTFSPVNTSSQGNYAWLFDSNATTLTSNLTTPSLSYSTGGNHTIKLIVSSSSGSCADTLIKTIYVEDPTGILTSTPTYSCSEPVAIQFNFNTSATIANWNWTFGDDSTSTLPNPTHTYIISDSAFDRTEIYHFTTTLSITTTNGCIFNSTTKDTISLIFSRPVPNVTKGCSSLNVIFSDSTFSEKPITSWLYNYGDGTITNFTNSGPHTHTYSTPGIYYVTMKATNNLGCFDISDTIVIKVGTNLPLDFTVSNTSICQGDSISFTNISANQSLFSGWNFSTDGELLSKCYQNPNGYYIFNDTTGIFNVTLTGDYNGCLSSTTKSNVIEVKGPIAKFNYKYDCSAPNDLYLNSLSNDTQTVSWEISDGNSSAQNNFTHTFLNTGDYTIKLTASNPSSGCPNDVDSTIFNIRNIQANFPILSNYCGAVSTSFDATNSIDVHKSCHAGYEWFFSDPAIRPSTSDTPTLNQTLNSSGSQTVGLVVTDINGCKDSLIQTIHVYNLTPDFSISNNTICLPDTIIFTNLSSSDTTITSYLWDFGDSFTSNQVNPNHIYNTFSGNIIPINLTISNALGCSESIQKNISIYKPTSTILSPISTNICSGTQLNFQASDYTSQGSQLSYEWNFSDGSQVSTINPSIHTFLNGGTFNVTLHYTEIATGCKDSTIKTINVQDYPIANFSSDADSLTALCNPQIIHFSDVTNGNNTSNWSFSNGINSTNPNPTLTFPKGNYSIQFIATTSFGCKDTLIKYINVIGPDGDFTIDINNICQGDSIRFNLIDTIDVGNFSWDFGDGQITSSISPISHPYYFLPPTGQTVAKLTLFSGINQCPVTVEKPIFIHYVKADFNRNNEIDTTICLGNLLNITNTSINSNSFQWDFGNGNTSTTSSINFQQSYSYVDTFDIKLIVSNSQYGCTDTVVKKLIVNPIPQFIVLDDTICFNSLGQLSIDSVGANTTFSWSPANLLNNSTIQNPIATINQTQIFSVTVTDSLTNCFNTKPETIFVIQPLTDIYFDTTIVVGDYINLPISNQDGLVNFTWTPMEGLSCTNCSNPSVQPLNPIIYNVYMEDKLGCSHANGIFDIQIYPETFIDLPTTFTPNGDGNNDIIYVKGWGIKDLIYFQIFNRWGELIFETSEISEGWNGFYKDKLQNNDTYTYKVKVKTWREEEKDKNGFINLMR